MSFLFDTNVGSELRKGTADIEYTGVSYINPFL